MPASAAGVDRIGPRAYRIPTDAPEADGTFAWDSTTLVVVEIEAAGRTGLGTTYGSTAIVPLIDRSLAPVVLHEDAFAIEARWEAMARTVRNLGRPGLAATAISAVDMALWDLKAQLLNLPLVRLLGAAREAVPIYGSGGFTSYADARLKEQLGRWVHEDGCNAVKMKIGTHPDRDFDRVRRATRSATPSSTWTPTAPTA